MTPRQALQALPRTWKVLGLILAIAGVGVVVGRDWAGLPAQVQAHDKRLGEVEVIARRVDRQYARIVCLLTLPEDLSPIQTERACP